MNSEVAWVLVCSGTQVQPHLILEPGYLPDYLSVSYDYEKNNGAKRMIRQKQLYFSFISFTSLINIDVLKKIITN